MKSRDSATMVFKHRVGTGDRLRRTDGPELEFVAGEGERARAVAVSRIARQLGQHGDADLHESALLRGLRRPLLQLIHHVLKLIAEEDGDDGGRSFVGAQAVIIGRPADGSRAATRDTWRPPG